MIEREKQRTDQQKRHKAEKQRRAHPEKKDERPTVQQAGKASDPETMQDKGYIERIEEKTEKH